MLNSPELVSRGCRTYLVKKSSLFFQSNQLLDSRAEFCQIFCSFLWQWTLEGKNRTLEGEGGQKSSKIVGHPLCTFPY